MRSWGTIRRVLQTHCYTTSVVPTKGGKTYRLRKAGEPAEMQKAIYESQIVLRFGRRRRTALPKFR